jgi:hypothetical protein
MTTKWAVLAASILLAQSGARRGGAADGNRVRYRRHANDFNAAQSLAGEPITKGRSFYRQCAVATIPGRKCHERTTSVTTVKVSVHPILLQMAATKLSGPVQSGRFDALFVTMPHGDAAPR